MRWTDSRLFVIGIPRTSVLMQSVLLRRVAQPNDHLSRSFSERSADLVNDTAPHNRNVFLRANSPSKERNDVVDWLQNKERPVGTHKRKQREIYTTADPSVKNW